MKKVISTLLSLTLLSPVLVSAHPGDWGRTRSGRGHCPGRLSILPDVTAVIIGGLTLL